MTTTPASLRSAADEKAITRVRDDLMSGAYFSRHASSHRSAIGYRPVLNHRDWAHAMKTIAEMAAESDSLAQVAHTIMGRVNLYGTRPEACAQIFEAAAEALRNGFDDVVGRSGPEAGRYSDHQRTFTLRERVLVAYWLEAATAPMQDCVPGVGWCVDAIKDELGNFYRLPKIR
jgi:hypothetical protein